VAGKIGLLARSMVVAIGAVPSVGLPSEPAVAGSPILASVTGLPSPGTLPSFAGASVAGALAALPLPPAFASSPDVAAF
jgi:hypothetical protein